jgi:uncharacterized protein
LILCATLTLWVVRVHALEVPPLDGRINDRANLLSPATEQRLTERLASYEKATGHQLAVLTIPTLAGDPLEDFSIRVVEKWKLGKQGKDDGVLLLVVSKDRKMRIEVGYGLEGDLPDALAGRIVRDEMAPRFRQGDFEGGIETALNAIIAKTGGEKLVPNATGSAQPAANATGTRAQSNPLGKLGVFGVVLASLLKFAFVGIFVVLFVIVMIANLFTGRRTYRRRSGGIFFGGGGFGGGSGGGGGGFSGGGGGFGGGGASGSW